MKSPSKVVLTSFLTAYLSIAPSLQNQVLAEEEQAKKEEIAQATQTETKLASLEISPSIQTPEKPTEQKLLYEIPIETKYSLLLEKCKETNVGAIERTRKVSGNLEKSIEKYGFEYIIGLKNDVDKSCLDLALKRINQEMKEKEFESEIEKIARDCQRGQENTKLDAPVNFVSEKMIFAQRKKIEIDTKFYGQLLKSDLEATSGTKVSYEDIVKAGLSEKQYQEITAEQLKALTNIYKALDESRIGFRGLFASEQVNSLGKARIDQQKEEDKRVYKKVYKSENKQANKQPDSQETKQSK